MTHGNSRWLYRASMRLRALVRGAALDRELDEELQFHVEQLVDANLARGLSPEAARREALLAIGGIEQRKEECRDRRRVRFIEDLLQDLRYAVRTLGRAPAFTTAAILTLTLGIGTTVAMFTVVNGVLLRPMPFPEPGRLHLVSLSPKSFFMRQPGMTDRTYLAFRDRDRTFLTIEGRTAAPTVNVDKTTVSPGYFLAMGIRLVRGREFMEHDDTSAARVAIVSRTVAKTVDPSEDVIGKRVSLESRPKPEDWLTIVGVVDDVKQLHPALTSHAAIYRPYLQVSTRSFSWPSSTMRPRISVRARMTRPVTNCRPTPSACAPGRTRK